MEAFAENSDSSEPVTAATPSRSRASKGHGSSFTNLLVFALLGFLTSFLGYEFVLNRVDSEIRDKVQQTLQNHYRGKLIHVGRAHLDPGRALIVEDITVSTKSPEGWREVFAIRRMVGRGVVDLPDLISKKLPIEKWEIEGLNLTLWRQGEKWSAEDLLPLPHLSNSACEIDIKDGNFRLVGQGQSKEDLVLHDLRLTISPEQVFEAQKTQPDTDQAAKASTLVDSPRQMNRALTTDSTLLPAVPRSRTVFRIKSGSVMSSFFRSMDFVGKWDASDGSWELNGKLTRVEFTPAFRRRLPEQATPYLARLTGLECTANASFSASRSGNDSAPQFAIHGAIGDGRLEDASLPYLLEDLAGQFYIDNQMLQLRDMRASSGQATFELAADIQGFEKDSPLRFRALAKNLDLDDRLYQALPLFLRRQWDRLLLRGRVDAEVDLHFDGQRWEPVVAVDCRGVSLNYSQFPYTISHLMGRFDYSQGHLVNRAPLTARANGQTIVGKLDMHIAEGKWRGEIDLSSEGWLPIDESLLNALTPRGESTTSYHDTVANLSPSGNIHIQKVRFEKERFDSSEMNRELVLNFDNGGIRFRSFPYPIHEITGTITVNNNQWQLLNCRGRNNSAVIDCTGSWETGDSQLKNLILSFNATDVTLEDELQQALPSEVADLWKQLQPKGRIGNIQVQYGRKDLKTAADLTVSMIQRSFSGIDGESRLTLQPISFPYLLEDVTCELIYKAGQLELRSASAKHGNSHLQTEGSIRQVEGGWIAQLKWLPTTRLKVDSDLISSLPRRLRETLQQADFQGPVGVLGWTQVGPITSSLTVDQIPAHWDLELDLEDTKLRDGSWIQGIRGTVRVAGHSTPSGPMADGFVLLDAMTVKGVPVTNIRGPFAIREGEVLLGRKVGETASLKTSASVTPNDISADIFGGQTLFSGTGQFDPMRMSVQANLIGGQLKNVLLETGQASSTGSGTCNATLQIQGSPLNPQTLSGQGEVRVTDAKLFQLPAMMRLLKFLSIKPPDDAAFEKADIAFRIDGDRVPIDHFSIDGDMLSLAGSGWANLRRELHLDLYAYVGNRNQLAKLVGPLLSETRYAPLMQVQVDGTMDAPDIVRKPLPVIEDALKTYFPERYASEKNRVLRF
jgi:hypothetical protein